MRAFTDPTSLSGEIVATLREPFLVLDAGARVLAASPAFLLRFGLSADRVLHRPVYRIGAGEWNVPALHELFETVAPAHEMVEGYEVRLGSGGGRPRSLLLNVRPVRRGGSRVVSFLVAVEEPRERADPPAAPRSLAELAAEASADLIALYRPDGTCLYAAPGWEAALGYSRAEMLARPACELLSVRDREILRAHVDAASPGDPPVRLGLRVRRRDGEPVRLETVLRPVPDGEGGMILHASARDATDRQRAEDALRWLSRQTKLILDTAAEGIFGMDSRGTLTFVNPAAARMLGHAVSDLIGQPCGILLGPGMEDRLAATLRDGISRSAADARFRGRDGRLLPVEYSCSPARERDRVVGAVVTFRDATERRLAEAAARRAEWLAGVGETIVTLRHEINNPLTTLLAGAALLEMGGNSPAEEREMIASMVDQARRIGGVVRRLTERQHDPNVRPDPDAGMLDLGSEE